ncbi:hypothetical protein AJ80_02658 [Polytolypa hystricis UAMH7299]|uniref:Uncharacterized protein n=1 Tax=Polytolypa hystricis (strain UAMH7299) TaxID=1447883 RepID=A0A2B7YQU9_POLH7|nr:hypothetical protein AJ80_02658 [Polytolypa hystricis UAMH7299]
MEVAASQPPALHGQGNDGTMDTTMDVDMDLDLGLLPEPELIQFETPAAISEQDSAHLNEEPQFEKVHIRGVDELNTDNIKRFATEHFTIEEPNRVEWIDDTSANIVYSSTDVGLQALAEFTQQNVEEEAASLPVLRLRTAKSLSTHPESVLQVRAAVKTDRKKARAYEASRFYLMHPEHDPRERVRREFSERRHRGRRDDSSDYSRRRFDDREHRRRKDHDDDFHSSMYDDVPETSRGRRGSSRDLINGHGERSRKRGDLFPDGTSGSRGRLRNRSASPSREEFTQEDPIRDNRTATRSRFRDRSPRANRDNERKELFPSDTNGDGVSRRELFPNKTSSSYLKKDLFPNKTPSSNHRRSDAFDAADETADLFSKRMPVPFMDGSRDSGRLTSTKDKNSVELFPEKTDDSNGGADVAQGFSIKGAASVRELFPSKYHHNEGKELFSDKIEGRGGRRRRAEDMFY